MIDEDAPSDTPGDGAVWTAPPPRRPGKYPTGARLAVGSILSFVVASLLYGPQTVVTMITFATVCSVGIGLLVILAASWLVGWVVLEVWSLVPKSGSAPSTS